MHIIPEKIIDKLGKLPDKPGCYVMRNRFGRIIYVGKAASLRRRVPYYFRRAVLRGADPKLRGLIRSIADFDVLVLSSEESALITENRLIKDYRPRYNALLKDDKRFPMLRVERNAPFPRFRLCRLARADGAEYFGPYAGSNAARVALEFIEKRFGLRRCVPDEPGPADHRHCHNDIIRFCPAPCIGKIGPEEYRARVEDACAFLRGERPGILREVEDMMQAAARARNYERAAALRDTLSGLRAALRERARAARLPGAGEQFRGAGLQALKEHLGLRQNPRLIEAYDISCISGTLAVGSLVAAVDGKPRPARYRRFRIKTADAQDDAAMLAEVIRRRFSRLRSEGGQTPDLALVDGGALQLRAARRELDDLGLGGVPAAGLAKRLEEIHRLDGVLRLPPDSPALHILQAIRDEAHRFALAYHRRLRARRISESALDEIRGIGGARKRILMERFGSVARIANAAQDAIAAAPGIGLKLARKIKERLREPSGPQAR